MKMKKSQKQKTNPEVSEDFAKFERAVQRLKDDVRVEVRKPQFVWGSVIVIMAVLLVAQAICIKYQRVVIRDLEVIVKEQFEIIENSEKRNEATEVAFLKGIRILSDSYEKAVCLAGLNAPNIPGRTTDDVVHALKVAGVEADWRWGYHGLD